MLYHCRTRAADHATASRFGRSTRALRRTADCPMRSRRDHELCLAVVAQFVPIAPGSGSWESRLTSIFRLESELCGFGTRARGYECKTGSSVFEISELQKAR